MPSRIWIPSLAALLVVVGIGLWILSPSSETSSAPDQEWTSLGHLNELRGQSGAPQLQLDEALRNLLREEAEYGALQNGAHSLKHVIQAKFPDANAFYSIQSGSSFEEAMAGLHRHESLQDPKYTHYGALFVERGWGLRRQWIGACIIMENLKPLELPLSRFDAKQAFRAQCRLCQHSYRYSFQGEGQSYTYLQCPTCHRVYELLGIDSAGNRRSASSFFAGMKSEQSLDGLSPMDQLMKLWSEVTTRCQYIQDAERISGSEAWQDSRETYEKGAGDCEDTSLLLADLLISHGFLARVAMGTLDGGGHAWVVVHLDGYDYLLESTFEGDEVARRYRPPYVEEEGVHYHPLLQVDRKALYVATSRNWTGDYWSPQRWKRIPYQPGELRVPDAVANTASKR